MTRPSWAQLTYTSFDPDDGRAGGWQVKEQSPDLTEGERNWALAHVSGTLTPVVPVSRFPSAEEITGLPRRMLLQVGEDGSGLVVHSTPAGPDASLRQGNVFNHVVVDREMRTRLRGATPLRAIQLWRSAGWLTPYGAEDVGKAGLGAVPGVSGRLTRESVAAWLLAGRTSGLAPLLTAVEAYLNGGPQVVIVAEDVDEGAWWIAAVCLLAAPQTDLQLSFCTYERSEDLRDRGTRSALSVVLRADLGARMTTSDAFVVVDPSAPWTGSPGRWSVLATAVCAAGADVLVDRLLALEELSELNADAAEACGWWPLAVAVSELDDLRPAWRTAAEVVLERTPEHAELEPATRSQVAELLAGAAGSTTTHAWTLLGALTTTTGISPDLLGAVYAVYLTRFLSETESLLGSSPPPVLNISEPARTRSLTRVVPPVLAATRTLLTSPLPDDTWVVASTRWLDLGVRAGLSWGPSESPVREVLARIATSLIGEPGATLVARIGVLEATTSAMVVSALDDALVGRPGPPGHRLAPQVLDWLAAALEERLRDPDDADNRPMTHEAVAHACRSGHPLSPDLRVHAALGLLKSSAWEPTSAPRDRVARALASVRGGEPWDSATLTHLVEGVLDVAAVDFTAEACAVLLSEGPRQSGAVLARAVLDDAARRGLPVAGADHDVLRLYSLLPDDWHLGDLSTWTASAEVVVLGSRLNADHDRVDTDAFCLLAPQVLAAAARAAAWSAAGYGAASGSRYDDELRGCTEAVRVCLVLAAEAGGRLLAEGMRAVPQLAVAVFDTAARLKTGRVVASLLDPDFLVEETRDGPSLSEFALREFLSGREDGRRWVDDRLHNLGSLAGSRDEVMEWALSLPGRQTPGVASAPLTRRR